MYELKPEQAQKIVDKMMKDIAYNINIMDKSGVIIGSGNKKRIGTLHQGAVDAITERKPIEIQIDSRYEKKGINLPIEIDNEIVGVVGISGEVKKVKPFANIVKSTAILLIEQNAALELANSEKNKKQEFFQLIINSDVLYTKEIVDQAHAYNIHLNKPSQMMYVELPHPLNEETIMIDGFTSFKASNHSFFIVIQEWDRLHFLEDYLKTHAAAAFISMSNINEAISEGYRQAKYAMQLMKKLFPHDHRITYASHELIVDLFEMLVNHNRSEHDLHLLSNHEELVKTLQVYISCNLNINETADELIIHRNTLNYRLDRIQQLTGKNPKNILELVELLFMLLIRE